MSSGNTDSPCRIPVIESGLPGPLVKKVWRSEGNAPQVVLIKELTRRVGAMQSLG
jgi:hypothetical protein